MASSLMLLSAVERGGGGEVRRRLTRGWRIALVMLGLLAAVIYASAFFGLYMAWETGNWLHFWPVAVVAAFITIMPPAFLPLVRRVLTGMERLGDGDRAMREAAVSGDEKLAPLAVLQPAPLAPGEVPAGELRVGPLRTLGMGTGAQGNPALLFAFLPLILFMLFPMLMLTTESFGNLRIVGTTLAIPFSLIMPLLLCGVLIFIVPVLTLTLRSGRFYVVADEHGLRWRRGRGRRAVAHLIPWAAVRSVYKVSVGLYGAYSASPAFGQRAAYVVDGGPARLLWTVSALARPRELGASESLLRLVVTRTGRPVRDLTTLSSELTQAGLKAPRLAVARTPAGGAAAPVVAPPVVAPPVVAPPVVAPALPGVAPVGVRTAWRPSWRGWAVGLAVALAAVVLLGGLCGGGAWLEYRQDQYFASMPRLLHARTPIYYDNLANDAAVWPVKAPSPSDYRGYAFVNGVYQLNGSKAGAYEFALEPYTFHDAAYEVTAVERGDPGAGGGNGVGLVLHAAPNQQDFLLFEVTYAGHWYFWRHSAHGSSENNWLLLTSGSSMAIQQNDGAKNQLLVIGRSPAYLFYVNGVYVGSYYDHTCAVPVTSAQDDGTCALPGSGAAGVYLDESTMTGQFGDFHVYAIPSAPGLDWIYPA